MSIKEVFIMSLITTIVGLTLSKLIQIYRKKKGTYNE